VSSKVAWVGRTVSIVFGLGLVLALLFGVASMALAGTGVNGLFNLGVKNTVDAMISPNTAPARSASVLLSSPEAWRTPTKLAANRQEKSGHRP
jgi:hypothetical protein